MYIDVFNKRWFPSLILIGLNFLCTQGVQAELSQRPERMLAQDSIQVEPGDGLVVVEPVGVEANIVDGKYELLAYPERRPPWTTSFGISYGNFDPLDYESEFSGEFYEDIFAIDDSSLIEFELTFQRNLSFGSLAIEVALGYYSANASDEYVDATTDNISINLTQLRMGGRFSLDTIFDTPYVVPYASLGAYLMYYEESLNSRSVFGNTSPAIYYSAGAKFQLNWLEPEIAHQAYQQYGMQNTFLFIEARQTLESVTEADPNFSSEVTLSGGLSIEI
ncbi:MAG: hypothetical protein CL677_10510 [Bdellovibrionaceae bacterium]|nr:hypothetical protein [Pseudobdellovibrionaceae bacterium]|tara:strand:- start:146469 stop:147299 length:831 start_codon:yes stop_codon:yes gene_type:complete